MSAPSLSNQGVRVACCTCLAAAGLLGPVTARGQAPQLDDLLGLVDPTRDDWSSEVLYAQANHTLKELGAALVRQRAAAQPDVAAYFVAGSRSAVLRPAGGQRTAVGPFQVRRVTEVERAAPDLAPAAALGGLLEPHRGSEAMRIKFKIVAVQPRGTGAFRTEVLYQGYSRTGPRRTQQNAVWSVAWSEGATADHPLIAALELRRFEEVTAQGAIFSDCTRSVIRDAALWHPQLAHGGEYWYGRLDAVGGLNFMGHHGIAVGDVNGDGLEDLYVAMGTGLPNKLLIQNRDGTVTESAAGAGVDWLDDTKGALLVDTDNDGDQDLLCAMGPAIVLCKNDGRGRFGPFVRMRAATPAAFYSLAAADYDLDGDVDIYGCRYVKVRYGVSAPLPFHDANNGPPNHLLRNDGGDRFTDVTAQVGLNVHNARFSVAAGWGDYDGDGDPDLYVANDFGRNNLYRNDGGRFVDVAAPAGAEDQAAGMGVSWSDYDLDGDLDLYVSNMFSAAGRRIAYQPRFQQTAAQQTRQQVQRHSLGNTLLANAGDGTFRDVSDSAGVRVGRWAWGARFADLNNDGLEDLVVPNGFLTNERKDDL